MSRIKEICKIVAFLSLAFALGEAGFLFWRAQLTLQSATAILDRASETLQPALEVVAEKTDGTISNLNAILIQGGLLAARFARASTTIEFAAERQAEYWDTLMLQTAETMDRVKAAAGNLANLIEHTDMNLNVELLPQTVQAMAAAQKMVEEATRAIQDTNAGTAEGLQALRTLLLDPAIQASMQEAVKILQNVEGTTAEFHAAGKSAPGIAANLEKMSNTSRRWQPVAIAAGLLATLARAFSLAW